MRVERDSGGTSPDECWYEYNGLNWRTKERRVRGTASGAGADTTRHTFYSLQWQQMLEVVEDASSGVPVKSEQQFWGLRGVDDAILRRIDADGDGEYGPTPDRHYCQLTDSSFSVIAHVELNSGWELQWMSYDAYGNMKVLHPGDFDGDGLVTYPGDVNAFNDAYSNQRPSADLNGDGQVTSLDQAIFGDRFVAGYVMGGNYPEVRIAYAGYVHDPVMRTLLARNRWYDPVLGRWLTRDPAGYVDGMSLYLFVKGNPLGLVDPFGLMSDTPLGNFMRAAWNTGVNYAQRQIANAAADVRNSGSAGSGVASDAMFFAAGSLEITRGIGNAAIGNAEAQLTHPGGAAGAAAEGAVGRAVQQEANRVGSENVGVIGVATRVIENATGATAVGESVFGTDTTTMQPLDGQERVSRGLTGSGSMLLIFTSGAGSLGGQGPTVLGGQTANFVEKVPHYLHRPYLRKSTREQVYRDHDKWTSDGRPIDPNTRQPIDGRPDMGHRHGHEFWRERNRAEQEGLTQKEFNDRMNNPDLYQLEDPRSNRSHRYEKPR